jgi:hypothetical protein
MRATKPNADLVRGWISGYTVAFGIPAYNEGDGILPTLRSLWEGLTEFGLTESRLILSDSHDSPFQSSIDAATAWAHGVGANLDVDGADRRRPKKEAINCLFDRAESDVLIIVDADVVVPSMSLLAMLFHLFAPPRPTAAAGATLPDPTAKGLSRRAGAWQLRAVTRAASLAPRVVRIEGAFWGSWRAFYSSHRLNVGGGSIAEDVEIARALIEGGYSCRNVPEAFVYKIPPGSRADMCLGTIRSQVSLPGYERGPHEYVAAVIEAARDPVGATMYSLGRLWCRRNRSRLQAESASESWLMLDSTKRRSSDC